MKVKVAKRVYQMTPAQFNKLLTIGKEQVTHGIYAIAKNGYAELVNEPIRSPNLLRKRVNELRADGWTVHYNK